MNLLLKAVAEGSRLETMCEDSYGVVDSNTLREVNTALPVQVLCQQKAEMNTALQATILAGMPRGRLEVAIDTHDEQLFRSHRESRSFGGTA
jgi:hypothetical protein